MISTALGAIAARAVVILAFGAILVCVSEFWFYRVAEDVDSILILLAYGLLGYLFFAVLYRFGVHTVAGLSVATCLLGFLIEGVAVPVVYADLPISIVWTSLAWHALITFAAGWLLMRHVLISGWVRSILFSAAFGLALGFWNGFMWNAQEDAVTGAFTYDWQPVDAFAEQFLFGYLLFLVGHIVFDRFHTKSIAFRRGEHLALWAVAGVVSAIVAFDAGLLVAYPAFLGLVALCLFALAKEARADATPDPLAVHLTHHTHIPMVRFASTVLIPVCAILTYGFYVSNGLTIEMNVVMILTAGPISAVMFLWALWTLLRRRGRKRNARG
ncbi:MAG: hypothetical protein AAF727_00735 [Pseudomonadota bacterium]